MRFLLRWCMPGLVLLAGLVGCDSNRPASKLDKGRSQPQATTSSAGDTQAAAAQANDAAITVKPVTWADYENTIKSLKGKVVVVDFWQTT
ncbi:MAG TPA: hypothetical protein VFA18_16425 [Gemmataceae bacterium]|nr:hypothetical protein [Gemmataceae bacterium]